MIRLTGREQFTVIRGGQRVTVRLRDLDFMEVLALANFHRDEPLLRQALLARQCRMRQAHDRRRVTDSYDGDDGGRAA